MTPEPANEAPSSPVETTETISGTESRPCDSDALDDRNAINDADDRRAL